MTLTNLQIDLLQETLVMALRDKYFMPQHKKGFDEKYALVSEIYDILEAERTHPVSK